MARDAFRIEPATPADIPRIVDILHANFRGVLQYVISAEQAEYMLAEFYTPDALQQEMDAGHVFVVARHDNEVRAFGAYGPTPDPTELKLQKVFVDPPWHGKGYGTALVEYVAEQARREGCGTLMLTVNKLNTQAIAVYEKAAFEITESVTTDIGGGFCLDDYVMVRVLTGDAPAGP